MLRSRAESEQYAGSFDSEILARSNNSVASFHAWFRVLVPVTIGNFCRNAMILTDAGIVGM